MWLNCAGSPATHLHSGSLRPSIFPAVIVPEGRLTHWAPFKKSANLNTATIECHKCDCKESTTEWKYRAFPFVNRRLLCRQVCVSVPLFGEWTHQTIAHEKLYKGQKQPKVSSSNSQSSNTATCLPGSLDHDFVPSRWFLCKPTDQP